MSKQVLWDCINVYTAAMGTERESQERAVLDQAIDAALASVSNDKLRELVAEWERGAKHQRTLMESVDMEEGAVAAGRMAVFEGCAGELEAALADSATADAQHYVDIVFDGPPGPESGRFVESENMEGASVKAGTWIDRGNGLWALRIPTADAPLEVTEEMVTAGLKATERWGVAKSQGKPTGSAPPYMVFEVGEHPRTFIEDILRAALTAQKEG